jgi:signal transduction histidine kinase
VSRNTQTKQIILIIALAAGISLLHLFTAQSRHHLHVFYRELYFLPLILAAFWFGLRGALATSFSITAVYFIYTLILWQGFSPDDFDKLLEIGLFNIVATVAGTLRDREKQRENEKLEGIVAMAGGVSHEMNTPLFSALGTAQLLKDELDSETENYKDVQTILTNLQEMRRLIQKISEIDRIEMKDYVGNSHIIDFEKSSKENEFSNPTHAEHRG